MCFRLLECCSSHLVCSVAFTAAIECVRLTNTHAQFSGMHIALHMHQNSQCMDMHEQDNFNIQHLSKLYNIWLKICSDDHVPMMCIDASKMKWKFAYEYVFSKLFHKCMQCWCSTFYHDTKRTPRYCCHHTNHSYIRFAHIVIIALSASNYCLHCKRLKMYRQQQQQTFYESPKFYQF